MAKFFAPLTAFCLMTSALVAVAYTAQGMTKPIVAEASAQASPQRRVASSESQWAVELAAALGNDAPTPDTIAFLTAWRRAEGGDAAFNPFNTTQDMPGATNFNSVGVKNYATWQDGLTATVTTLGYSYQGYADIRAGIQTNDAQRALQGLSASPWGTNAALVAQIYQERTAARTDGLRGVSQPISVDTSDGFGYNVAGALAANNGALQEVTIQPGQIWSFNRAMGDPANIRFVMFAGVPGGGWCDLASRYVQAARAVLPSSAIQFSLHGEALNQVAYADSVVIWNTNGGAGEQDLIIENTTNAPITFRTEPHDGQTIVVIAAQQGGL